MTLILPEIPDDVFWDAVYGFWDTRIAQAQAQTLAGRVDQGNRSSVTGGKQMDGFILTITNLLLAASVPQQNIHVKKSLTVIPGFFRPTKNYDFLVVDAEKRKLKVVIELKSQVGSFGNNFNNRTEEAMGAALDIWTAYREGVFGSAPPPPWVGYWIFICTGRLPCFEWIGTGCRTSFSCYARVSRGKLRQTLRIILSKNGARTTFQRRLLFNGRPQPGAAQTKLYRTLS